MPKATALAEVLNLFDPERALSERQELRDWYVSRADSPLDRMAVLLRAVQMPQKLVFTGHHGSGKSTELAKLSQQLQDQFWVVLLSVKEITDIGDIDYADVALGVAIGIFRRATDPKHTPRVTFRDDLLKTILSWFEQVKVESRPAGLSGELGAELNLLVGKLVGKLRTEPATRTTVREQSRGRLAELRELLGYFIETVEQKVARRVLVIVDDLDKIDLERSHNIFFLHSATITAPPCFIIYTFPVALLHHNDFEQMAHAYSAVYNFLPNFPTHHRDDTPDPEGQAALERIITNRAKRSLFTDDALEHLVLACGGLPRDLMTLVSSACTYAMVRGASQIDRAAVDRAILERRIRYQILLSPDQLRLLAQVHRTKKVQNDAEHRLLLHNLSALEYHNGEGVWWDAHPIVRDLLTKEQTP